MVGGRLVVVAGASVAAWSDHVSVLRAAGADNILIVANAWGAGPVPDATTVVVEAPNGLSTMEQIRSDNRFLADPPIEVVDALDEFDPGREALVLGSFLNTSPHLAGRRFVSHRRPEWVALEDKVVVDAFWDRAGIAHQPSAVVSLDEAVGASATIDRGAGTVWAADAREGFHGGASQTYWVADDASLDAALEGLRPVCDRVRVMPFLDGIPCSIHGIVLPDGVAVFRPVEMVTLRRDREFVYAGCATYWDPPDEVRAEMRSIASITGARLADELGFRGAFTVDGVVASDGFWPTELNPRFGAGLMTIARARGAPILLVNDLVVGGHDLGRTAAAIEEGLLTLADDHRGGGTWIGGLSHGAERSTRGASRADDGTWRWSEGDVHEPSGRVTSGVVTIGPGLVRCVYDPDHTPIGPSTAPRACEFWRFVDRELDTASGALTPAPDISAESCAKSRHPGGSLIAADHFRRAMSERPSSGRFAHRFEPSGGQGGDRVVDAIDGHQ